MWKRLSMLWSVVRGDARLLWFALRHPLAPRWLKSALAGVRAVRAVAGGPAMMNPIVGWGLAVLGIAAGYVGWGWPGVVLGVTVVVFWLLLQFSRSLRVLKKAAGAPVGHVDSAVMLHSKLKAGMTLMQVLVLTRSLGTKLSETPGALGLGRPGRRARQPGVRRRQAAVLDPGARTRTRHEGPP